MQPDITFIKKNESYLTLKCSGSISHELREYFTFHVPGYQFTPAFRNRLWDGKIRIFDIRDHSIYKGLEYKVKEFCEDRNYHYVYDYEEFETEMSLLEAGEYIDGLQHTLDSREYQIQAFTKAIRKKRQILLSPTASGKSKIIYDIIRYLIKEGKTGIIIVPTVQLVEQLHQDFKDYSTKNLWDVESNTHRIYEGKPKNSHKVLTISTWQSIYTQPPKYFEQFDFVIGDEVHKFKSKSLTYIMSNAINAEYRIGLTGSLDGTQTHQLVLEGLFGPIFQVTTTKKLIEDKFLSPLKVKCLVLKHSDTHCQEARKWKYQDEIKYLISSDARNRYIKNLALSLSGNTLILFQYVKDHGKVLYKLLEAEKNGKSIHFIYGGTDVEVREMIRTIVNNSTDNIIVASYGTTSTGINIPNLHNVIFASPSKARIRNLQSIGRILRKTDTKDVATVFDIADDLRWKTKDNTTFIHFVERIKLYVSESFDYKIYKLQLKD